MLSLIKYWRIAALTLVLFGAMSGYIAYLGHVHDKLLQEQARLEMHLEASQNALEAFAKDKAVTESTLAEHAKKRSQAELENSKLMKELQRLKNESKDKCLVAPVDPNILDRL